MTYTYKRPDGQLEREAVVSIVHTFSGGIHCGQQDGYTLLTGRWRFRYIDGKITRWYTAPQAPKWLQVMIREMRE